MKREKVKKKKRENKKEKVKKKEREERRRKKREKSISILNVATGHCTWWNSPYTRGLSFPVLSY